ncbi:phenazine biosynthesis-like domain-containing protein 1 [Nephila pilipes]|uniref:Phenazine biosynthesis-like domain-containing protein 1 n=1 Tax=Nephila pilipes TaxID=299642 RepID=A0A8X6R4V0_NEPPI|nr:phenazine biosynthesis-like domain-containing protein 1 [Nephila pilipes]
MANLNSVKSNVLSVFYVDAFTKKPFSGNGAAVCLLPYDYDVNNLTRQKIASEINLSETAFVKIIKEGDTFQNGKRFALDWFTPLCQVPLCGHATLASAAVLFTEYNNESEVLEFETVSGILKAQRVQDNRIEIDLPAYKSDLVYGKYEKVVKAVVKDLPVENIVLSVSNKLLIHLCDNITRKELEGITTNDAELLTAEPTDIKGVIVTLKGSKKDCVDEEGNQYDFISRYFAPWFGISEDPVTGAAHSVLAPYWSNILQQKDFYARQCSRRGGELHIRCLCDRILLSGNAVIVIKGQLHL